jgi:hypothetical protein
MKGNKVMSTECIGCLHTRKVVSDALAVQEEIILSHFAPAHTRFVFQSMTDRNVISELILQFRASSKLFGFDNILCIACTRDEVAQRIAAAGQRSLDFDTHYSNEAESAYERVESRSWEVFADLNKAVVWDDEPVAHSESRWETEGI